MNIIPIIITITALVVPTIYNTQFYPTPTLKQLSICIVERQELLTETLQNCNENDNQCMVNVVTNLCQ